MNLNRDEQLRFNFKPTRVRGFNYSNALRLMRPELLREREQRTDAPAREEKPKT